MKLIVGLGNPGLKYKNTWHNLGFITLDYIQNEWDLPKFKKDKKFQAIISMGSVGGEKIILAKPQTFMNNSGLTVSGIASYYKISLKDIIVIHDDIDLPLNKIRVTDNSSAGGHNGIKSIIEHLGGQEFTRIKIGIRTDKTEIIGAIRYVLERIGRDNKKIVSEIIKKTSEAAGELVTGREIKEVMNGFN